jgi:hypothetical protein
MSDMEKHQIRLDGLYDLSIAINHLPAGSRILGVPSLSLYHIDSRRLGAISEARTEDPPWTWTASFDYVVYDFRSQESPAWSSMASALLHTQDGYALYATGSGDTHSSQRLVNLPGGT